MMCHIYSAQRRYMYFAILYSILNKKTCSCFHNSMMCLLCVAIVAASCLLSSDKKGWKIELSAHDCGSDNNNFYVEQLKYSDEMPLIDIDIFPS